MNRRTFYCTFAIFFAFILHVNAQSPRSVLGKPNIYENPKDVIGLENAIGVESRAPWIVVSDRDGNQTFKTAGGGSPLGVINFKDWFYVVETNGDWLHIAKGSLGGKDGKKIMPETYEDFGWVTRKNMLLWTNSLINPKSGIHRKAFLLNKVEDIEEILKRSDEKLVKIYTGPDTKQPSDEPKTIYEFYFIYKYDDNVGRFLVGKESEFSTSTLNSSLVGWVEARSIVKWDTRLALEPNYEEAAFGERKKSIDFQICAYSNADPAKQHAVTGKRKDRLYWDNDPVTLKSTDLSNTNPRRFRGGVVRFPVLGCEGNYYNSGVVGEISYRTAKGTLEKMDEVYYSHLSEQLKRKEVAKNNYDILLVVEGVKNLAAYRESLINGVKMMKASLSSVNVVRFGVSVYRDVPEEKIGKLSAVLPMTQNVDKVIEFINNIEFARWEDNDPWTSMNYGIAKALKECGVSSEKTNIIFVLGQYADFSYDPIRRQKDKNHFASIPDEKLVEDLSDFNVNLIGLQVQNSGDRFARKFQEQIYNLIQQSAITQFQRYKGTGIANPEKSFENPEMPDIESGNDLFLSGGSIFGELRKPASGNTLSYEEVSATMRDAVVRVNKKVDMVWEKLRLIIEEGAAFSEVNPGDFTEAMIGVFGRLKEEGKFTDDDLKKVVSKKYKLYAEVYIPRKIQGASYTTTSLVLFMPEKDLKDYVDVLNKLRLVVNKSPDEQRETLYDTFVDLVGKYAGNKKAADQLSVEDLRNAIQGIEDESCGLPTRWGNIKIADIKDKRKMKDDEIKKRIDEIIENTSQLQKIVSDGRNYEFSYTLASQTYFWIPIEYTF